ncbi:MAG: NAD(P)/FAD-dependent oxidoreductase [Chitinivibrionia bacterium]|nr:NAD(P)/FAD-dependent oxidoreductase [Chitinivibrionia bacterium]
MLDICIIGGGTAGISAAKTASEFNFKSIIFEKNLLGGVCLNCGCVPSKIYLGDNPPVENIYNKFNKIRNSFQQKLKHDLISSGVEIIESEAEILPKNGENFVIKSGDKIIESKYLIIASGSVAKGQGIFFPKTQDEIPENVDILGGGIAGFEAAQIFNALGSKVRVLEKSDKFCANLSQNAVNILVGKMQKNGIEFVKNFDGEIGDNVYFANGRKFAPIKGIENLSLQITENGVSTDEFCRTSAKNCFAIGDINSKSMLAHTAEQEGFVAINKIIGNDFALDYESIPAVLYTDPSIVRVGVLPTKDTQYEVRQMPLSGNAKFRAMTDTGERGLCEAVIEKESGKIAGLHLISPNAEEISAVMALIVQKNLTVQDIRTTVFAHPTISEIIKETIFYGQIV